MTYDQKKALTNTTAMTPQSNFDWEPNIVSASSTYNSDEGQRPQRSMRGDVFLKYVFPEHWTADGMPATGRILLLHDIHYVVLRWPTDEEKKQAGLNGPAETIPVERGAPEPDLKALNANIPEENWEVAFGKKQPPYRLQRILEFLDLANMDTLSWPQYTEVSGASICVDEVRKRIATARKLTGEDLYAVVKLNHCFFSNNYNKNLERPWLEIVNWARLGPHGVEIVDISKPKLPPQGAAAQLDKFAANTINAEPARPIEPLLITPSRTNVPIGNEMGDGIPWK